MAVQTRIENNPFLFLIKDECSFVSLRDVERAMQVMVWFYKHADTLGRLMREVTAEQRRRNEEEEVVIKPFDILCSNKYNSTENRICVIDNPTIPQNAKLSYFQVSEILSNRWKCSLKDSLFARKLN